MKIIYFPYIWCLPIFSHNVIGYQLKIVVIFVIFHDCQANGQFGFSLDLLAQMMLLLASRVNLIWKVGDDIFESYTVLIINCTWIAAELVQNVLNKK